MTHDDSTLKALAFYRYVGADPATLQSDAKFRQRRPCTGKAQDLFAKVKASCRKAVRSQLQGLERILECPCCGIPLKKVRWKIFIDDTMMKDAHSHYVKSMR